MIELLIGLLVGTLFGAAVVGIVIGGTNREREIMAFRSGYQAGLEDRDK